MIHPQLCTQQVKPLIYGIVFPILTVDNRIIKESSPMCTYIRHFIAGSFLFLTGVALPANAFDLIIPAYANPCCGSGPVMWESLIGTSQANPGLTVHVIFNPASGPGVSVDPNYIAADGSGPLHDLKASGAVIYGYVATGYAGKPIGDVKNEIDRYFDTLYVGQVDGIFLDEMSNDLQNSGYYRSLNDYVKRKNVSAGIIGNPGISSTTNPSGQSSYSVTNYMNSVDTLVIFEQTLDAYQNLYNPPSWLDQAEASRFAHIVHTAAPWDSAIPALAEERKAGLLYITDDEMNNPYDQLPSYWTELELVAAASTMPDIRLRYPLSLRNRRGSSSDQPLSVLAVEELSGTVDEWSAYREFYPSKRGYRGEFTFSLLATVQIADIISVKVETNYRGPVYLDQKWTWKLRNFNTRKWVKIGDNQDAADW